MSRPRDEFSWTKLCAALLCAAILLSPAACAIYRDDHCFVEEDQYKIAYSIFLSSGSLDVVERQLKLREWRRCQINEAVYRLQKEFEVVSN